LAIGANDGAHGIGTVRLAVFDAFVVIDAAFIDFVVFAQRYELFGASDYLETIDAIVIAN
jgi:hypothetical protein